MCPQGKLGGCTVISCDVTLNYTTYYLNLWTTSPEAQWCLRDVNAYWNGSDEGKGILFLRGSCSDCVNPEIRSHARRRWGRGSEAYTKVIEIIRALLFFLWPPRQDPFSKVLTISHKLFKDKNTQWLQLPVWHIPIDMNLRRESPQVRIYGFAAVGGILQKRIRTKTQCYNMSKNTTRKLQPIQEHRWRSN